MCRCGKKKYNPCKCGSKKYVKDQVNEYEIDKFDAVVKLMDCLVVSLDEELGGGVTNVVRRSLQLDLDA